MQKNYVIIGASSGIGAAISKQLLQEGHNVYTFSRTPGQYHTVHSTWDVVSSPMDISNLPDSIHGLCYCPGSIQLKPFNRFKNEDFMDDFKLNVLGAVEAIRTLLPQLKKGNGSVVLFSTVAAKIGMPFHSSIAVAKAGIEGLCLSLAAELAPHIRVNTIAPSLTHTPLAEKLLNTPEKVEASCKRHPLNTIGKAEEIAALAVFLMSNEASFITGQIWGADGGMGSVKTQ